jgi:hypothetical protein
MTTIEQIAAKNNATFLIAPRVNQGTNRPPAAEREMKRALSGIMN